MLHHFLTANRAVLDQLTAMLPGGSANPGAGGHTPESPQSTAESQMAQGATRHGEESLLHHFTIDEVVRDASAVTEFARTDDGLKSAGDQALAANERLGALAHEMQNLLNTAILAISAIKRGSVGFHGATASALDRSLIGMRGLIDRTLADVRIDASSGSPREIIEIGPFIRQVQVDAALETTHGGRELTVLPVEPRLFVEADRPILAAAIANLLRNAFKLTHEESHVLLRSYASNGSVYIEVEDESTGLPQDMLDQVFRPDRAGAEPGLSASRKGVEANGGKFYARNISGRGCVCVIELPRKAMPPA